MENLDIANEVLAHQQNILKTFDDRVSGCNKKFKEVEKFAEKYFDRTTVKHKSLIEDVLNKYARCATDYNIVVTLGNSVLEFTTKLREAHKKGTKAAYLPAKLFADLSKIVHLYTTAFNGFHNGLAEQAQQALAHRDALLLRVPIHRRGQ